MKKQVNEWIHYAEIDLLSAKKLLKDQINDVYIDARYPGDLGLIPEGHPSIQTVKRFSSYANDVFKKVKRLLKDEK